MNNPNALADDVALLLVREYLSALPGYPYRIEGEQRLASVVAGAAVSVAHARAFLDTFDQQCPTPREIKDQALKDKERMYPAPDPRIQWQKELDAEAGQPAVEFEPIQKTDSHLTMMKKAADRLGVPLHKLNKFHWGQIYAAWEDLGYRLNSDMQRIREGAVIPPRKQPVLQVVPRPIDIPDPAIRKDPGLSTCSRCCGTGRVGPADDYEYCSCPMGRDLYRAEVYVPKSQ